MTPNITDIQVYVVMMLLVSWVSSCQLLILNHLQFYDKNIDKQHFLKRHVSPFPSLKQLYIDETLKK